MHRAGGGWDACRDLRADERFSECTYHISEAEHTPQADLLLICGTEKASLSSASAQEAAHCRMLA